MIDSPNHTIIYRDVDSIKAFGRNARKHPRDQINAIAKSIRTFGFNAPILVDRSLEIIAGHGRLEAAKVCGLKQVPTIDCDHLSETQVRAYRLAENKLAERSSWDDQLLAVELQALADMALDFDIELTGFEAPEIDFRIQSLDDENEIDRADDFKVATEPATSRIGDVWVLGNHRVMCGNSLDPLTFQALMNGRKAAAVFADPPYNVRIRGNVSGLGKKTHREFPMASGEMNASQFSGFLTEVLTLIQNSAEPGAIIYVCMDWRHMEEVLSARCATGLELLNLCVWNKSNGGMGSFYRSKHELIFVFRNGPGPHKNNVQLGKFGRNRSNVWSYAGANSASGRRKRDLELHPTVKPIRMVVDAILDCTAQAEIVLDPFLGSGTTVLAAERTGRSCYGLELDPLYVDTIIARWEAVSGGTARLSSGESFAEIQEARRT